MNCPTCQSPVNTQDTICRVCGTPLKAEQELRLPPGTTLRAGRYRIEKVLGQGGFGITYLATDLSLERQVAVKELFVHGWGRAGKNVKPNWDMGNADFQQMKARFLDEARLVSTFNDPRIVRVFDFFEENDSSYLVMEFLVGKTLGKLIEERGALDPTFVSLVAIEVAEALRLVHAHNWLHRDVKPDNIYLHQNGSVILIDFGSVRTFELGKESTHTRMVTPGYAPLEQYASSGKIGPPTDIYSLGATLHHALTGQMPTAATDLLLGTPLAPLPANTPPGLRRAVEAAMQVRIEQRPQTVDEFIRLVKGETPAAAAAGPARTAASAPAPPAAPGAGRDLVGYLEQHQLSRDQFLAFLIDGRIDPLSLPRGVRDVLERFNWLTASGEVTAKARAMRRG